MRKYIALALVILLSACSSSEVKEEESQKVTKVSETNVSAAEVEDEELPWEKYDTQEIYDLVKEGEQVFKLEHAEAIENEFFHLYESGELTEDWGKYLHVYGAKLQPENPDYKEYFDLILKASTNIENGMFDEANRKMENAEAMRDFN
ncbi:hypothetical protein MHI57_10700 [Cytobacillus sp. FSL K6-0129]|uniref:hypothetical protein n=1 Tax=Cytobacillus sp. FSL K6-0129 TaxID=2921421 RepID=UPI0030FC25BE